MPDTKISLLPVDASLSGTEIVPIVDSTTKRTTVAAIAALATTSGAAGGDLGGTYPNPTVTQARGIRTTTGPTTLTVGAITDGQILVRSGTTVIGQTGAAPTGSASGDLAGTFPSPTVTQARGLRTTSGGGTTLAMGAVTDGQGLRRSGTDVVGVDLLALTSSAPANGARTAAAGAATTAAKADHAHDSSAVVLGSTVASSVALPDQDVVYVDTTSAAISLTLPGGTGAKRWEIAKINAGANKITLVRAASETIQGTGANFDLPDSTATTYPSWTLIRDASGNYRVL